MTKKLSCLVQEFEGMNFFQESDVVAQVGEERVLGKFWMFNMLPTVECPKTV